MRKVPRNGHRLRTLAGTAAIGLTLVWGATALAGGPYSVAVKVVPNNIPLAATVTVTASGASANLSHLLVFRNRTHVCAATAAANAPHPGNVLVINARVVGAYTKSKVFTATAAGNHFACAYLTATLPSTLPRASASAPYTVG
jgi:hypothetical protein